MIPESKLAEIEKRYSVTWEFAGHQTDLDVLALVAAYRSAMQAVDELAYNVVDGGAEPYLRCKHCNMMERHHYNWCRVAAILSRLEANR